MDELNQLNWDELGRRGGAELLDHELGKLISNIADLNTKPDAKRSITVKLTFAPSKLRDSAEISLEIGSKLVSIAPVDLTAYLDRTKEGRLVALTRGPIDQEPISFPVVKGGDSNDD